MNVRALPAPLTLPIPWRRIAEWAVLAVGYAAVVYFYARGISMGDALQWYSADLHNLYGGTQLDVTGYVYPPPLAQVIAPLAPLLPFWLFGALIMVANVTMAARFVGAWLLLLLLLGQFEPIVNEVLWGPANVLIGAAVWYGLRWSWLWTVVLLTKVTPGIGVLWFAVRGEWRSAALAVIPAALIAAASFALAPNLWVEWIGWSMANAGDANGNHVVPLLVRLSVAAGLVAWGARTDRLWAVPVAAALAHTTLAWAIAAPALGYALGRVRIDDGRPAARV